MACQITGVSIVCSIGCSVADKRTHLSSASLAFVRGIPRWPVGCPYKGLVTRHMCPFNAVWMCDYNWINKGALNLLRYAPRSLWCLLKRGIFCRDSYLSTLWGICGLLQYQRASWRQLQDMFTSLQLTKFRLAYRRLQAPDIATTRGCLDDGTASLKEADLHF